MQATFTDDPAADLNGLLGSVTGDEDVEGLILLATPGVRRELDLDEVLAELELPVFGGLFPELIYEGDKYGSGALLVGLTTRPRMKTVPGLSNPDKDFAAYLDDSLHADGYETTFVFVDAYSTEIERFIEDLFRTYGVEFNFIGGGAGAMDMEQRPCLLTNEGVVEDAAVVAALEVASTIGVRHGWQEIAGPFRVTDASGPTLETLDGKPAFDIYHEAVEEHASQSLTGENFFEVAKSHPFGISRMDAERIVRDPFEVTEDGSLTCFGDVPEGEFVHILRGDPDALVEAAGEAASEAREGTRGTDADALFFFDCISRVLYLEDDFERELAAVADDSLPMVGALTIGEIANDGEGHLDYYNKTAVVGTTEGL